VTRGSTNGALRPLLSLQRFYRMVAEAHISNQPAGVACIAYVLIDLDLRDAHALQ